VALKLVAPGLLHKTEIGGVLLDVDEASARSGYQTLMDRAAAAGVANARVLVTPMVRGGLEAVIGTLRDPQFGPVVMFGLGGIFVEALDDVVFRLAPVTADEGAAMLRELRSARLLTGLRGRPPLDADAAIDVLVRVSELAAERGDVAEIDLNPVFLLPRGAAVADARVVLEAR
jgi:acyl-CoA synthetase (NDP forming)